MMTGCGRFTDTEWAEYLLEPSARPAMARHLATCALCGAEIAAVEKTGALLRHVSKNHEAVRDAFARSVVAEHLQNRPVSAPSRLPAWLARLSTVPFLPVAGAAAVCVLLVLASFSGWLPWASRPDEPTSSVSLGHVVDEGGFQLMMATEEAPQDARGAETFELFMAPGPALLSAPAAGPVVDHVFAAGVREGASGLLEPEGIITHFAPGTASFHTVTYLALPEGGHDVEMALFAPDGALVASQHLTVHAAHGSEQPEALWLEWNDVTFPQEGAYRFVVTVGGLETSFAVPVGESVW